MHIRLCFHVLSTVAQSKLKEEMMWFPYILLNTIIGNIISMIYTSDMQDIVGASLSDVDKGMCSDICRLPCLSSMILASFR